MTSSWPASLLLWLLFSSMVGNLSLSPPPRVSAKGTLCRPISSSYALNILVFSFLTILQTILGNLLKLPGPTLPFPTNSSQTTWFFLVRPLMRMLRPLRKPYPPSVLCLGKKIARISLAFSFPRTLLLRTMIWFATFLASWKLINLIDTLSFL